MLHDELYPVKIDNVKRIAVLDEKDEIRAGAAEAFGGQNRTKIFKIAWLSKRDVSKAYESMVVYVIKKSDATRYHSLGQPGRL
jgi:hypothetical protein